MGFAAGDARVARLDVVPDSGLAFGAREPLVWIPDSRSAPASHLNRVSTMYPRETPSKTPGDAPVTNNPASW